MALLTAFGAYNYPTKATINATDYEKTTGESKLQRTRR